MIKQLYFKGVKLFVHKKDYPKIEKQNNISINVFGCEDETPYRIYASKQTFEKHAIDHYYRILKILVMLKT